MRIAYLTAGAGGMYCGSCMRDNTLAAALRRQGREVHLLPVYSPIRTDEEDVSESRVLFGGINVYLDQKSALFRRLPRWVHRLLDAPGLLRLATRRIGSTSPRVLGDLTVSVLRGDHGPQRRELDAMLEVLAHLRPDVVHLPNLFFTGLARTIAGRLGAAIVCTLTGEDLFLDALPDAHRAESLRLIRAAACDVHAYVAVTRYYGAYAAQRFGIPDERVHHVPLGIHASDGDRADERTDASAATDDSNRHPVVGYLARIGPEKGLHLLVEAFIKLHQTGRRCRLAIAGYLPHANRSYLADVRRRLSAAGLDPFVDFHGEVNHDRKCRLLRACDVFSVPTIYHEAKGLYVLEALAQGAPVVQPAHGSFPELVEATGGGLLCKPCDADDLARTIAGLIDDADLRRRLGETGRRAVREAFTDERMAEAAWKVFEHGTAAARRPPASP